MNEQEDTTLENLDKQVENELDQRVTTQIKEIGYAVMGNTNYAFTVGLKRWGLKDLIMVQPRHNYSIMSILTSKLVHEEISQVRSKGTIGTNVVRKGSLEEFTVQTKYLGKEPMRFAFLEPNDEEHDLILRSVYNLPDRFGGTNGYLVVELPDLDNRLFGENECTHKTSGLGNLVATLTALHLERLTNEKLRETGISKVTKPPEEA